MTRHEIENIQIGQTGLYQFDRTLPVCRIDELREVLVGPSKGKAFRYITVQRLDGSATIGFIVSEE